MNNFICIGFDIWPEPKDSCVYTNTNTWEDTDTYDQAISLAGIEENFMQLLNPKNKKELNALFLLTNNTCEKNVLIGVLIDENVFKIKNNVISSIEPTLINDLSFSLIGYDICDIDGFFSIFDMGQAYFPREKLLSQKEVEMGEAADIISRANDLIPAHAPFYLVKLCRVENRANLFLI